MESIKENQQKSKGRALAEAITKLCLVVVLLAIAGTGLFQLSTLLKNQDHGHISTATVVGAEDLAQNNEKAYIASKNGKAYYLPSCSGVARIKEENKVYFATKQAAEAAGYAPAATCPGLK